MKHVERMFNENVKSMIDFLPAMLRTKEDQMKAHARLFLTSAIYDMKQNEKVGKCEPSSILRSLAYCMMMGLLPGAQRKHAYLVPFWNNKLKYSECTVITGYMGYQALLRRNKEIIETDASVVYERDRFENVKGITPRFEHEPYIGKEGAGELISAWSLVRRADGHVLWRVVNFDKIEKIRAQSIAKTRRYDDESDEKFEARKQELPWNLWYPEMATKTAVREHAKFLELPDDVGFMISLATDVDSRHEQAIPLDNVVDVEPIPPPTESQAELAQAKEDDLSEMRRMVKEGMRDNEKDGALLTALEKKTGITKPEDVDRCKAPELEDALTILSL